MRGRLISPFKAKILRLDTVATAADPDGAGELTSGYDPDFREPVRLPQGEAGGKSNVRKEHPAILVPCQFEGDDAQGALEQMGSGDDPRFLVRLVFHFRDLENMGLVDPTSGEALIRKHDRFVAIHRFDDESLIQLVGGATVSGDPPVFDGGLYCVEPRPVSFGLSGGARNLLVCVFSDRDSSYKGGA